MDTAYSSERLPAQASDRLNTRYIERKYVNDNIASEVV